MRKRKITSEGQPCRHCNTAVVTQRHKPHWKPRPGHVWYSHWLACQNCKALYMLQSAAQYDQLPEHQKPAQRREQIFASDDHFQRLGEWANRLYFAFNRDLAPIPSMPTKYSRIERM